MEAQLRWLEDQTNLYQQRHLNSQWRVNNLFRQGFISGATTLSLPFFAYPVAGSDNYCGVKDAICGGAALTAIRPGVLAVGSPSSWDLINQNHTISTVDEYRRIWGAR